MNIGDKKNTKPVVWITGATIGNKGSESMLLTAVNELGKRLRGARFVAWVSYLPKKHFVRHEDLSLRQLGLQKGVPDLYGMIDEKCRERAQGLFSRPKPCHAIVDVGGFSLSDKFGNDAGLRYESLFLAGQLLNIPTILLPQSVGPLVLPGNRSVATRFLPRSHRIYLRGRQSFQFISDVTNGSLLPIEISPDIAFLFRNQVHNSGPTYGEKGKLVLGVCPSIRLAELNKKYVPDLTAMIQYAVQQLNSMVILFPHEIRDDGQDDIQICRIVMQKLPIGIRPKVIIIDKNESAHFFKSVIAGLHILVTSRYHSAVAALSVNVPPLILGWADKYVELMELVHLSDLVLENPVVDDLIKVLDKTVDNRSTLVNKITSHMPAIYKKVEIVFDQVASDIKESYEGCGAIS